MYELTCTGITPVQVSYTCNVHRYMNKENWMFNGTFWHSNSNIYLDITYKFPSLYGYRWKECTCGCACEKKDKKRYFVPE